MKVDLQHISKAFGATKVVRDVTLEIADGELFFLLGPSGCGKTTLLRLLAGFYQPDAGEIRFGDNVVNNVPPNKRGTGMVFQSYALWPHLTVFKNVAYGLNIRRVGDAELNRRVLDALALVQMTPYKDRSPNQLSGGQQQRVALARALVIKPDVLLLDEPLSNLDAKLRLEMREEIRRIHRETKITAVYVTHDQQEALSLADSIAVMRDGRVEQLGPPRELYRAPRNRFVAGFMGEANFIEGKVVGTGDGEWLMIETALGVVRAVRVAQQFETGQTVTCAVRPESVKFGTDETGNRFDAVIQDVSYRGDVEQVQLELPQGTMWKATEQNPERIRRHGDRVTVSVRPQDVIVMGD